MSLVRKCRLIVAFAALSMLVPGLIAVPPTAAAVPLRDTAVPLRDTASAATTSPRLNQVWSMGSHNSYYFEKPGFELEGSGPSQHLLDDLFIDRMRGVEFDLHRDPGNQDALNPNGRWGVYHTGFLGKPLVGQSSLCTFLDLCLNVLRAWHFANPDHDPLTIRLEAHATGLGDGTRDIWWNDQLTPEYLDSTLTRYLHDGPAGQATTPSNDWIFGPKDYYQWCQNTRLPQLIAAGILPAATGLDGDNLKDAVKKCGWPTLDELKGKFIVNLFGTDPVPFTGNADSVDFYSHGQGRTIAQMKIFPEASVVEGKIGGACGQAGVCNWNDHTVFAETGGDLDPNNHACTAPKRFGGGFPCYVDPNNGNPLSDPGRQVREFIENGGIIKAFDQTTQSGEASVLNVFSTGTTMDPFHGGLTPHGFNLVGAGDAPRNMPVNFTPGHVDQSAYLDGVPDWSYGCLWDVNKTPLPGCNSPLHEQQDSIFVRSAATPNGQLSDHVGLTANPADPLAADQLVFLSMARDPANTASLKAFVSTRKGRLVDQNDDFGPTYTGDLGCLMARADLTDPKAPFFALCRYGHRNGGLAFGDDVNNEGLYVLYRSQRGGPVQAIDSLQNPILTNLNPFNIGPTVAPITHQGLWELQPFFRIQPNAAGTCWSGFTRSTDDPSPQPGWGEAPAWPQLCVAEPLNFVGLATDGGREEGLVGEYAFANVAYDGLHVTTDPTKNGTLHLATTQIGAPAGAVLVQDRSYFDHDLAISPAANVTVNATTAAGAIVTYTPPTASDPSDPTNPPVTCAPGSGGMFPIGVTTVTCSATDPDDVPPTVSTAFTVTVKSAAQQLGDLLNKVHGLAGGALTQLVMAIQGQLSAGRIIPACNLFRSFIGQVRGRTGAGITTTQAQQLIADATRIATVMGCN
jgi:hypothetical protein